MSLDSTHQDSTAISSNSTSITHLKEFKQFILSFNTIDSRLLSVDAQSFFTGDTLKAFTKMFGGINNGNKSAFLYEEFNSNKNNEDISMAEHSLKNHSISH